MQIQRAGRIHYLAPKFSGPASSIQGFTTRHGGVSRAPYNSLNLGMSTLDQRHSVEGNRNLLIQALGDPGDCLLTARQVHGNDILLINEPNADVAHFLNVECDAIITDRPGVMIGVCVADCVPILLLDPDKRVASAVHAGWRGTAAGLVCRTVEAMKAQFSCNPASIQAAIGPCIMTCCYEVDAPVKRAFEQGGIEWSLVASPIEDEKWKLNLSAANRNLLLSAGVMSAAIQTSDICVCCERDQFFSHRRDNGETGRQIGFIMLKKR